MPDFEWTDELTEFAVRKSPTTIANTVLVIRCTESVVSIAVQKCVMLCRPIYFAQ